MIILNISFPPFYKSLQKAN